MPAGLAIWRSRGFATPPVAADISRNDVSSTFMVAEAMAHVQGQPFGEPPKGYCSRLLAAYELPGYPRVMILRWPFLLQTKTGGAFTWRVQFLAGFF